MILRLPEGYNTQIGEGGTLPFRRSAPAHRRWRAPCYGNPKIIVLDEPNSSLDSHGEAALAQALRTAKSEGRTILVISHRASLLNEVDKLAVFTGGTLTMYGPTREVMERLNPRGGAAPATAVPAPQPMGQVTHMTRASS